ncbi:MAG: hypothetical protein JWN43_2376, partial [Gammaproteobacteria bacterium]|nr:hypothetical protein [Gammaproteobacteria bacterium]
MLLTLISTARVPGRARSGVAPIGAAVAVRIARMVRRPALGRSPVTVRSVTLSSRLRRRLHDLEYRRRHHGDAAPKNALYVAKQSRFVTRDERYGFAGRTRAASTTDAVYVILGYVGQFVIDHLRQLLDIEAAGRDLGGYQSRDLSALEHVERFDARCLALVAMDRG